VTVASFNSKVTFPIHMVMLFYYFAGKKYIVL
jgi:hypothetical protein